MEAAFVAAALVAAALIVARGMRGGEAPAQPAHSGYRPPLSGYSPPVPVGTSLATVVRTQPPLRIFSTRGVDVQYGRPSFDPDGADYTLTLARGAGGRWSSVLHAPDLPGDGGALTVTLVVPWHDIATRYSAVNLVVR